MVQEAVGNIAKAANDVIATIHTAMPGTIYSIDGGTGLATVKPHGMFTTPSGQKMQFPIITGVPLVMPQCSVLGIEIAFPVKEGDSCLIIFSEQELDNWLYGRESQGSLRFDLTNAIAIPGLGKAAGTAFKEACSTGAVVIANGGTKLSVSKSRVAIQGDLKVEGNISYSGSISGA